MLPQDNGDDATDLNLIPSDGSLIPSDGSRPIETAAVTSTSTLKGTSKGTLGVGSGTELRAVMAVLRRTWGWTSRRANPQSGAQETVHDRWAQLSKSDLASATGRSETAVGQAARALQGAWIERVQPGNGP